MSDAVYMVGDLGVSAGGEHTVFILHELLEPVTTQNLVLLVVALVLLWNSFYNFSKKFKSYYCEIIQLSGCLNFVGFFATSYYNNV